MPVSPVTFRCSRDYGIVTLLQSFSFQFPSAAAAATSFVASFGSTVHNTYIVKQHRDHPS
jgi:hypothetical protein